MSKHIKGIISKVEKLLALSKSSNINEAANALHKAQEIIHKYNLQHLLDGSSGAENIFDDFIFYKSSEQDYEQWIGALALGVLENNGCSLYLHSSKDTKTLFAVGDEISIIFSQKLFTWILSEIIRFKNLEPPDENWREDFCVGAVNSIIECLKINKQKISLKCLPKPEERYQIQLIEQQKNSAISDKISSRCHNLPVVKPQKTRNISAIKRGAIIAKTIDITNKQKLKK